MVLRPSLAASKISQTKQTELLDRVSALGNTRLRRREPNACEDERHEYGIEG